VLKNWLEKERHEVLGYCNVCEILLSCPSCSISELDGWMMCEGGRVIEEGTDSDLDGMAVTRELLFP